MFVNDRLLASINREKKENINLFLRKKRTAKTRRESNACRPKRDAKPSRSDTKNTIVRDEVSSDRRQVYLIKCKKVLLNYP